MVSFINLLSQSPGHAQCHTSLLATSSLGDGPNIWSSGTGYSVRPVAQAIKIKHAGLNPEDWASLE